MLNDQIMEQRVMSESDLAKRAQLKKNILDINLQLQETAVSAKEALMLRQQLFNNNQQEEALVKTINSRLPVSTQKYGHPVPANVRCWEYKGGRFSERGR